MLASQGLHHPQLHAVVRGEQIEEEALARKILDKLAGGDDRRGYLFDRDIVTFRADNVILDVRQDCTHANLSQDPVEASSPVRVMVDLVDGACPGDVDLGGSKGRTRPKLDRTDTQIALKGMYLFQFAEPTTPSSVKSGPLLCRPRALVENLAQKYAVAAIGSQSLRIESVENEGDVGNACALHRSHRTAELDRILTVKEQPTLVVTAIQQGLLPGVGVGGTRPAINFVTKSTSRRPKSAAFWWATASHHGQSIVERVGVGRGAVFACGCWAQTGDQSPWSRHQRAMPWAKQRALRCPGRP